MNRISRFSAIAATVALSFSMAYAQQNGGSGANAAAGHTNGNMMNGANGMDHGGMNHNGQTGMNRTGTMDHNGQDGMTSTRKSTRSRHHRKSNSSMGMNNDHTGASGTGTGNPR